MQVYLATPLFERHDWPIEVVLQSKAAQKTVNTGDTNIIISICACFRGGPSRLSLAACDCTTASGTLKSPSSEGAGTSPSLRESGLPEAVVQPQAARESKKFFMRILTVSSF